ncbi:excisionase family DNA-binding protein [Mycobacterium sp. pV006]|uniref:excisionase family DNA-binding protein n=1 Tax=Mycobacterium sp. pV006 TaxID=3238983 RepID=UPI00351AE61B
MMLTLTQAAARTGVSTKTLRRRIAEGLLPAYRVAGRSIRVRDTDLDTLMRPIGGDR